ncbi:MAG: hypothetical protein HOV67_17285 [Kribbellaceae bacterium]|nr:hypothetical protein [Kribbellaceae bacterium]
MPTEEEAAARRDDARDPREAAALVARFTGSDFQPPAGSRHENYKQLAEAGVPATAIAAKIRAEEAKAAQKNGNSR